VAIVDATLPVNSFLVVLHSMPEVFNKDYVRWLSFVFQVHWDFH
jgi:hypothetical protein